MDWSEELGYDLISLSNNIIKHYVSSFIYNLAKLMDAESSRFFVRSIELQCQSPLLHNLRVQTLGDAERLLVSINPTFNVTLRNHPMNTTVEKVDKFVKNFERTEAICVQMDKLAYLLDVTRFPHHNEFTVYMFASFLHGRSYIEQNFNSITKAANLVSAVLKGNFTQDVHFKVCEDMISVLQMMQDMRDNENFENFTRHKSLIPIFEAFKDSTYNQLTPKLYELATGTRDNKAVNLKMSI